MKGWLMGTQWQDEELVGEASYDVGDLSMSDVRFRIANLSSEGVALSAENMGFVVRKEELCGSIIYDGSVLPGYEFGALAEDGVSAGVLLARGFVGQSVWACGRVYLVRGDEALVLDEPAGVLIEADCAVCCPMGRRVIGAVYSKGA